LKIDEDEMDFDKNEDILDASQIKIQLQNSEEKGK